MNIHAGAIIQSIALLLYIYGKIYLKKLVRKEGRSVYEFTEIVNGQMSSWCLWRNS